MKKQAWFHLRMRRIVFAANNLTSEKCLIGHRVTLPNSKCWQYLHPLFFKQPGLFIIFFHLFLWNSFPAMLPIQLVYRIQLWTQRTMFLKKKTGSLERTAFVHSSMQQINRHYGSFEIDKTAGSYFIIFFYRKGKAKNLFSPATCSNLLKRFQHELN